MKGAPSSIAAGPGPSALPNPAGHFAAVAAGAHAVPRGRDRHLARGLTFARARGGLHLPLLRPLPGAGREVPGQPRSSSTRPGAFPGLRGWEVGGLYADASSPPDAGFLGHPSRTGAWVQALSVCVSAGSLGGDRGEPLATLHAPIPDFAWRAVKLVPGSLSFCLQSGGCEASGGPERTPFPERWLSRGCLQITGFMRRGAGALEAGLSWVQEPSAPCFPQREEKSSSRRAEAPSRGPGRARAWVPALTPGVCVLGRVSLAGKTEDSS